MLGVACPDALVLTFLRRLNNCPLTCSYIVAKDIVRKLLTVDPTERLTVTEALDHPYFQVT